MSVWHENYCVDIEIFYEISFVLCRKIIFDGPFQFEFELSSSVSHMLCFWFRGFPVWLKYVPGIEFRTNNEPFKVCLLCLVQLSPGNSFIYLFVYLFFLIKLYKAAMKGFTEKIVNMMKAERLFESQGGPIIMSQVTRSKQWKQWLWFSIDCQEETMNTVSIWTDREWIRACGVGDWGTGKSLHSVGR